MDWSSRVNNIQLLLNPNDKLNTRGCHWTTTCGLMGFLHEIVEGKGIPRQFIFQKPTLVFLSETKGLYQDIAKKIKLGRQWHSVEVDANGRAGGLILLWNVGIEVKVLDINHITILTHIIDSERDWSWYYAFVYGEPNSSLWWFFWDNWLTLIHNYPGPLVCINDWNCLGHIHDKRGGSPITRSEIKLGCRILNEANLSDLGSHGLPLPRLMANVIGWTSVRG